MTDDPDYKIEEYLDCHSMLVKYNIIKLGMCETLATPVRYNTLDSAKDAVRALRKYEKRIFHYVDDVEQ